MRIDWVKISSFGTLSNYEQEFTQINCICQENSSGKTTLASFIKAMLYGLSGNGRQKDLSKNDRAKYASWQGGVYGGSMRFSFLDGKSYIVERTFGRTEKEDTFKLFEGKTNAPSSDYNTNLGYQIFGVDESAYERTIFVPQKELNISETDSLTARLNSSVFAEEGKIEDALFLLRTTMGERKNSGLKKSLEEAEYKQARLANELRIAQEKESQINQRIEKKAIAEKNIALLETQKAQTKEELTQALQDNKLVALAQKREVLEDSLSLRKKEWEELKPFQNANEDIDTIAKLLEQTQEPPPKIEENNNKINLEKIDKIILSAIFAVFFASIGLFFANVILGAILLVLALSSAIISYFCYILPKNKKQWAENNSKIINQFNNKISNLFEQIINILNKYNLNANKNNYLEIFSRLKILFEQVEPRSKAYQEMATALREFDLVNGKALADFEESDSQEISQRLDKIQEALRKNQLVLREEEIFLEGYFSASRTIEDIKLELFECEEEISRINQDRELLRLTIEFLGQAKQEMSQNYVPKISTALQAMCHSLNIGERVFIDENLNIFIEQNGLRTDFEAYSKGTKEILQICLRFALLEALFESEKPFLIFDDPFTNLDETRLVEAFSALKRLSKDSQIIYFTCHKSRVFS